MTMPQTMPQPITSTPQVRSAREERPLLYRFEAHLDVKPLVIAPEGLRMLNAFDGRITAGMLEGARVSGVDHLLVRHDGVGIIDAPKTISLGSVNVVEHVTGYCLPPAGLQMPPFQAMFEPGFAFPDLPFTVIGSSMFRTDVPELAHLNACVATIEGTVSFATGRLVVETRLLPIPGVSS